MANNGNSNAKPLILYLMDYDPSDENEKKTYQINTANGRTYMYVAYSDGSSIEFLIRETYEKLEAVRSATPGGWAAVRRWEELKLTLVGDASDDYETLEQDLYPNPADKTTKLR